MKANVPRLLGAVGLSVASACGSYVKYEGDPTPPGTVSVGSGSDAGTGIAVENGKLDHWAFGALLGKYVEVVGAQTLVDYDGLAKSGTALDLLESYRSALAQVDPETLQGREQRLAFWLNAYNVNVLAGVLAQYEGDPKFSVITSGTFFTARQYKVAGVTLALDEIEQGVIRGDQTNPTVNDSENKAQLLAWHESLWGADKLDPRIHVGLNCASLSCPNLLQKAWQPETLEADLQAAIEAFLSDPVKGAGPDGLSALVTWYKPDFEGAAGSVRAYVEQNRKGGLDGVALDKTLPYDWTLNIAP